MTHRRKPLLPGAQRPFVDALLLFEKGQDGERFPVARHEGERVVLGDIFDAADRVRAGESWRCRIYARPEGLVAEPLDRAHHPLAEAPLSADGHPAAVEGSREGAPGADADTQDHQSLSLVDPEDDLFVRPSVIKYDPEYEQSVLFDTISHFPRETRVALFVHGPQAQAAARAANLPIMWDVLFTNLVGPATEAGAYYYDIGAKGPNRQRLHAMLSSLHYSVRPAPTEWGQTAQEREEAQRALDAFFCLDVLETAVARADVVFLFVNDTRFLPLVRQLHQHKKRVFILTSWKTVADELSHAVDKPIFRIEDFVEDEEEGGGGGITIAP